MATWSTTTLSNLTAGWRKFTLAASHGTAFSAFGLFQMAINTTATYTTPPPSRVFPVAPGVAVPVSVSVDGVPAQPACGASTLSAAPAVAPADTAVTAVQPVNVTLAAGTCAYMYSSHRTPQLVSAVGLAGVNASTTTGMGASGLVSPNTTSLQVRGRQEANSLKQQGGQGVLAVSSVSCLSSCLQHRSLPKLWAWVRFLCAVPRQRRPSHCTRRANCAPSILMICRCLQLLMILIL